MAHKKMSRYRARERILDTTNQKIELAKGGRERCLRRVIESLEQYEDKN